MGSGDFQQFWLGHSSCPELRQCRNTWFACPEANRIHRLRDQYIFFEHVPCSLIVLPERSSQIRMQSVAAIVEVIFCMGRPIYSYRKRFMNRLKKERMNRNFFENNYFRSSLTQMKWSDGRVHKSAPMRGIASDKRRSDGEYIPWRLELDDPQNVCFYRRELSVRNRETRDSDTIHLPVIMASHYARLSDISQYDQWGFDSNLTYLTNYDSDRI
jgi:hypothetical protein